MAEKGKLLAMGMLFITALYLFLTPQPVINPTEDITLEDSYPQGGNWTANGSLGDLMVENPDGTLTLSGAGDGTYTLNETYVSVNSSLSFDNINVRTNLKDDNDNGEMRVYGIDRSGTIQESEVFNLQDGVTQYGLDEEIKSGNEYSGYYFQIYLESSDNQRPEVTATTIEYDELKPITNNSLADNLLAFLLVIAGIGVMFQ